MNEFMNKNYFSIGFLLKQAGLYSSLDRIISLSFLERNNIQTSDQAVDDYDYDDDD